MNENSQAPENREEIKAPAVSFEGLWIFEIALGLITSAVALIAAIF